LGVIGRALILVEVRQILVNSVVSECPGYTVGGSNALKWIRKFE
jgi:hypothetical protein